MIKTPPNMVLIVGSSLITNHTQSGPNAVSNIKNNCTSCAGIYLGANVKKVKGSVTRNIPIMIIRYKSIPSKKRD